ncbi:hypothetical protein BBP40_006399 [Aspergillus hancockii]|nr:hypothetical protein BBP40_006399 [Aspergillus hancockii]
MNNLSTELLLEILNYADRDVASLLTVNHRWFHGGISIIYASVIRSLRLDTNHRENLEAFSHVSFPKLTRLSIKLERAKRLENEIRLRPSPEPAPPLNLAHIKHFMSARLELIDLDGGMDPELLEYVQSHCPRLHTLMISSPGQLITAEAFRKFLQGIPSVSSIRLSYKTDGLVTGDVLNHLAERNNLRSLSIDQTTYTSWKEISDPSSSFAALRELNAEITECELPSLVAAAKSVAELSLTLFADDNDLMAKIDSAAFLHVSKMTKLRRLDLFIRGDMRRIRNDDLVSLRSLTQLTVLKIHGGSATSLMAGSFTDSQFEALFANLTQLQTLTLKLYRTSLTADALVILGKCCRLLESCNFMGNFCTMVLKREKKPLFPVLERLNVGMLECDELRISNRRPYDHVLQIEKHFPKLDELECDFRSYRVWSPSDLSDKVVNLWYKRREKRIKAKLANE